MASSGTSIRVFRKLNRYPVMNLEATRTPAIETRTHMDTIITPRIGAPTFLQETVIFSIIEFAERLALLGAGCPPRARAQLHQLPF